MDFVPCSAQRNVVYSNKREEFELFGSFPARWALCTLWPQFVQSRLFDGGLSVVVVFVDLCTHQWISGCQDGGRFSKIVDGLTEGPRGRGSRWRGRLRTHSGVPRIIPPTDLTCNARHIFRLIHHHPHGMHHVVIHTWFHTRVVVVELIRTAPRQSLWLGEGCADPDPDPGSSNTPS